MLRRYLARFDVAQTFGKDEEVEHWFLSGQGREVDGKRVEQVTWAYVVEVCDSLQTASRIERLIFLANQDPTTHLVTDLISFYSLPSTIMKHKKYNLLNAAYLFYYASDVIFSPCGSSDDAATQEAKAKSKLGERLNALVQDVMVIAQKVCHSVVPPTALTYYNSIN